MNPLFNSLGSSQTNKTNSFLDNFNNFKQTLGGNPAQLAEQRVKQLLQTGQISQQQFNQASQIATMLQKQFNL